jgi:fatty acid/phospholipid biosynthesis enzyme
VFVKTPNPKGTMPERDLATSLEIGLDALGWDVTPETLIPRARQALKACPGLEAEIVLATFHILNLLSREVERDWRHDEISRELDDSPLV